MEESQSCDLDWNFGTIGLISFCFPTFFFFLSSVRALHLNMPLCLDASVGRLFLTREAGAPRC